MFLKRLRFLFIFIYCVFYFLFCDLYFQVYEGLIAGTLPVYRGAESIMKFMPSRTSIINANQMTAKEIADLLT